MEEETPMESNSISTPVNREFLKTPSVPRTPLVSRRRVTLFPIELKRINEDFKNHTEENFSFKQPGATMADLAARKAVFKRHD